MLNRTLTPHGPSTPQPQRPELQRIVTDTAPTVTPEIAHYYQSGQFADPKPQKAYFHGPQVFTDGHQRLIQGLREECQKLTAYNRHLKNRASTFEGKLGRRNDEMIDLRQSLHAQHATIQILQQELQAANQSIQELDQVMTQSRAKRLNRLSQVMSEDVLEIVRIKDETGAKAKA